MVKRFSIYGINVKLIFNGLWKLLHIFMKLTIISLVVKTSCINKRIISFILNAECTDTTQHKKSRNNNFVLL